MCTARCPRPRTASTAVGGVATMKQPCGFLRGGACAVSRMTSDSRAALARHVEATCARWFVPHSSRERLGDVKKRPDELGHDRA